MSDESRPEFSLTKVVNAIEDASENARWFANAQTGEVDCCIDPCVVGRGRLHDALKAGIRLSVASGAFSVCKLGGVPKGLFDGGFCCVVKTAEEVSLVCETARVPEDTVAREDGWRALKVQGPLDFGLVGILSKISSALADAEVPLFAISTFDTDYILVKEDKLKTAVSALRHQGCEVDEGL